MSFAETYAGLISYALNTGVTERNARTGRGVAILPGGASFTVDLSDGVLPTVGRRLTRPKIAAAELAWCLLGHNHCDWLQKYTKVWNPFCDVKQCATCEGTGTDSGDSWIRCSNCNGSGKTYWLNEAYGFRWNGEFGIDQLAIAMERLKNDPSDRRCWISSWDPSRDILDDHQKTVPCPVGFTLQIIHGRLCSTLMIRSSDLFIGLPYDVMRHSLLMAAVASELRITPGTVRFTLANPHIYEHQLKLSCDMLEQECVEPNVALPTWPVSRIKQDPDYYVQSYENYCGTYQWPIYNPKSEVAK